MSFDSNLNNIEKKKANDIIDVDMIDDESQNDREIEFITTKLNFNDKDVLALSSDNESLSSNDESINYSFSHEESNQSVEGLTPVYDLCEEESDDDNIEGESQSDTQTFDMEEDDSVVDDSSESESHVSNILTNDCVTENISTIPLEASYPTFYNEYMESNRSDKEIIKFFKRQDWITARLRCELNDHAPTMEDMTADPGNCSVVKNINTFEKHARKIFPSDRIFANYKQLDQYLTEYLSTWSNLKHRNGNCYRCSYSPSGRVYTGSETCAKNRNKSKLLKNAIKCPFKITFNQK